MKMDNVKSITLKEKNEKMKIKYKCTVYGDNHK